MTDRLVTVFGASGRQGVEQIRALRAKGFAVRAVTRGRLGPADLADIPTVPADYLDPASLATACDGAEAVFYTAPAFANALRGLDFARNVGAAAAGAGARVIFNTSSWVPDEPVGQPGYDGRLGMENAIEAEGAALTVFRPVLFMDNLLTAWAKPFLQTENAFVYPHRPGLEADWICLEDVAAFMVAALDQPHTVGRRAVIGGPQTLTPATLTAALSDVLGRPITHRFLEPRAFGELMAGLFAEVAGGKPGWIVKSLEAFYTFNNTSPLKPFRAAGALEEAARAGVTLTPFQDWAGRQDWASEAGGFSGG